MTGRQTGYLKKQHTVYIKLKLKLPWGLKYIYTQKLLFRNLPLVISHQCKLIVLLIFFFFSCLTINIQKGLLILCGFCKCFWTMWLLYRKSGAFNSTHHYNAATRFQSYALNIIFLVVLILLALEISLLTSAQGTEGVSVPSTGDGSLLIPVLLL